MSKYIIFNWKMNPDSGVKADKLFGAVMQANWPDTYKISVAPPFSYLERIADLASETGLISVVSQDISSFTDSAVTGEISAAMIKDTGATGVIIGHSERRFLIGETNEVISKKISLALESKLQVILCVGEFKNISIAKAQAFVSSQLRSAFSSLSRSAKKFISKNLLIAYEPVFAIGTGKPMKPARASEMIGFIKNFTKKSLKINIPILYGGSIDSSNLSEFLSIPDINGALIGSASLKTGEIRQMANRLQ